MLPYLYHNGSYYLSDTPLFTAANRAFRYGDSIFESIAMQQNNMPLFNAHWKRLTLSAELLQMQLPQFLEPETLLAICKHLRMLNGSPAHARIRVSLYRSGGGLYLPENNTANLLVELAPQQHPCFRIGLPGLGVVVYPHPLCCYTPFSHLKTGNALPYIAARMFAEQHGAQDCLLLNHHNTIAESTNANIFWLKDGQLFTPPLTSGCVDGVMRQTLLQRILPDMNIACFEEPLYADTLLQTDEMMLTNATSGIRHVATGQNKKYGHTVSETIQRQLVVLAKGNV